MVSGRYFLPKAPELWRKLIPASAVPSANWIPPPDWVRAARGRRASGQRDRQEQREHAPRAHRRPPCGPATGGRPPARAAAG